MHTIYVIRVEIRTAWDIDIHGFVNYPSHEWLDASKTWYSQCHRLAKSASTTLDLARVSIGTVNKFTILSFTFSNNSHTLVKSVSLTLAFQPYSYSYTESEAESKDEEIDLADTFLYRTKTPPPKKTSPPKKAYLFFRDSELDLNSGIFGLPCIYIASDQAGRKRWSREQYKSYLEYWDLTPEHLILTAHVKASSWSTHHYDALREVHAACGFDPDGDEIRKALGYPILQINPLYGRFSKGMLDRSQWYYIAHAQVSAVVGVENAHTPAH